MYTLEPAKAEEADECVTLLSGCRDFQRAQGFVQWQDGFPEKKLILADIAAGKAYLLKQDGAIAAYMYLDFDGEPAYDRLVGVWNHPAPYAVIHRLGICASFRGKGISSALFSLVQQYCASRGVRVLRIDTHFPNTRMQHVLLKNGFSYAGIVQYGAMYRMAFDKRF